VADAAMHEWERAIVRSQRRWEKIKAFFPKEVRRFEDEHVCLHDAQVLSMGQQGDTFVIVLETEPPARNLVVLTFTLDAAPVIDTAALPNRQASDQVYWLYEEFDVDRRKRCSFEVLLSNGWSVKLLLRDFHFLIAREVLSAANGPVIPPAVTAVPQPA
jgi:hypothetical protein